jgi:hypothetical protein
MVIRSVKLNFKDKTCPSYIRTQSVTHSKHSPSRLQKTNILMLYKERSLFFLRSIRNTKIQSERQVQFLNVEIGGT